MVSNSLPSTRHVAAIAPSELVQYASTVDSATRVGADVGADVGKDVGKVVGGGTTQMLVDGSHVVPVPQSEACTGQTVAGSSLLVRQQQMRIAEWVVAEHDVGGGTEAPVPVLR